MNIQVPGSFVTFGSYAKPGILPDVMALAIFGFKIFCTMMSINTGAVIISKMEKNYGIQGDNCIKINGGYKNNITYLYRISHFINNVHITAIFGFLVIKKNSELE